MPESSCLHLIRPSMSSIKLFCAITANNGERVPIEISTGSSSMQLRQEVSQATKIPLTDLRLIFRGKMIKDDSSPAATTYQLENEDVLHCMGKPVSALAPLPAAASRAHIDVGVAAAATPNIPPASLPVVHPDSTVDPLQSALTTLRTSNPPQVYCTAVTTLATVLSNIADNPMEEKYRKVKKGNVAFNKKLGGLNGGDDAMKAVGFIIEVHDGAEFYQMHASPEAWSKLMESKATVEAAAVEAKRSLDTPVPPVGGANPLFPGAAAGAMHDPMMQGTMAEMMRNPEMMRSMLQNPMVQQLIQNDPNIPPMQRNMMQQLASNPAMLDQLSTMMSNPAMMSRMQSMMGAGGMPGMPPRFPTQPPHAGASSGNNDATNANRSAGNDQAQTEDEMIAEAIRRSLQDN